MPLDTEDHNLILDSVQRLCQDLRNNFFAHPEQLCGATIFAQATQAFVDQGLLNLDTPSGLGLWESDGDPESLALTLDLLSLVGRTNAALALSLHRSALARRLSNIPNLGLCLHGHPGLGRGELARWWTTQQTDFALLSSVLDARSPRLALMQDKSDPVLCPVFDSNGAKWYLAYASGDPLAAHGLNELYYCHITPTEAVSVCAAPQSKGIWHREWLALIAIQKGCLQHALQIAQDYSRIRYQGGKLIYQHPAVQALLCDLRLALNECAAFLSQARLDDDGLEAMLLRRNTLQDRLSVGINSAMQIMGGIGYMKDTGIEKCFRDMHQLRYQSGGPLEMQQLAASWETT